LAHLVKRPADRINKPAIGRRRRPIWGSEFCTRQLLEPLRPIDEKITSTYCLEWSHILSQKFRTSPFPADI
jgi:hypothetical protein